MNIKKIRKKLRPIKRFYLKLIFLLSNFIFFFIPNFIMDFSTERKIYCKYKNIKFSLRNFSKNCRFRANTFSYKEPDTLDWIDTIDKDTTFLDIGANVGIYSLYASFKTNRIFSFEPDALNYSLLNLNILDNKKNNSIKAFPISMHSKEMMNTLNIQKYVWGGALSSFANKFDQFEREFTPEIEQGSYALTIDKIINFLEIKNKCFCKIDVDGNELEILKGAKNTFQNKVFSSVLVELDTSRSDYNETLDFFKYYGYILKSKKSSPVFKEIFASTQNHIFYEN